MKSFSLILVMWVLALATIYLLNRQHEPINGGLPVVKSSMANATFVCTPAIAPRLQRRNREIA